MARIAAIMLIAGLLLAGCQTNWNPFQSSGSSSNASMAPPQDPMMNTGAPSIPNPGLGISPDQRFPDVPLPVGLTEDPERTFVYESASLSVGRMVYTTKADVSELAQFYIDESPVSGWQRESLIQTEGADLLFRKPGKTLKVVIRDLGLGRGRRLTLTMVPDAAQ